MFNPGQETPMVDQQNISKFLRLDSEAKNAGHAIGILIRFMQNKSDRLRLHPDRQIRATIPASYGFPPPSPNIEGSHKKKEKGLPLESPARASTRQNAHSSEHFLIESTN